MAQDKPSIHVNVDRRRMKNIAIRCRCGHRFRSEVPGEIEHLETLHTCPSCSQQYLYTSGVVSRLDAATGRLVTVQGKAPAAIDQPSITNKVQ